MRAKTAKTNRLSFERRAQEDARHLSAVEADPHFTEAGRNERAAPIRARMRERFDAAVATTRTLVEAARAEYETLQPRHAQARAALKAPERAAAVKALALGASAAELQLLVAVAAETNDLAAAHGIRLAFGVAIAAGTLPETDAAPIARALARLALPEHESATADYVAARIELDQLVRAGVAGDVAATALADPVAALTAARAAASIPLEDGTSVTLSDAERIRLQTLAGTIE